MRSHSQKENKQKGNFSFFYVVNQSKQATETCNCLVNKNMNYTRLIRSHWRFAYMHIHFLYCNSIEFNLVEEIREKKIIHNRKSNRYSGSVFCTIMPRQLSVSVNCVAMVQRLTSQNTWRKKHEQENGIATELNSIRWSFNILFNL